MAEALRTDLIECALSCMAEGRMAEIVAERDRLGQILVQAERPCDRPRDLRHLERVRQAGAVVVALGRNENLRFVGQAAERLAVQDAVAVALKAGPVRAGLHFLLASRAFVGKRRPRRKNVVLARLQLFAYGHDISSPLVEKVHFGDAAAVARQRALKQQSRSDCIKTGGVYLGFDTSGGRKFPHGNFRTTCVLRQSEHRLSEKRSFSTVLILPPSYAEKVILYIYRAGSRKSFYFRNFFEKFCAAFFAVPHFTRRPMNFVSMTSA